MNIFEKSLMLAVLVVATEGIAQTNNVQVTAPSSVDKIAPVTQPLAGTLLFGREQRDQMDRVRKVGAVAVIDDEGVLVEPAVSVLNGFVKRSDGQTTIWVDGQARYNAQGDGVRRLQPQDVGGENERQVLLKDTDTPVVDHRASSRGSSGKAGHL
ncbi:MAG: hypothetical protein IPP88_05855 [Betaproteobacteria bacterium]|nr:hypothetical protein [Betaproteobacteria bacterium]